MSDQTLFDAREVHELQGRVGVANIIDLMHMHCAENLLRAHGYNLACADERAVAQIIIRLAGIEPGDNMIQPSWSEWEVRAKARGSTSAWYTPSAWIDAIPRLGIWRTLYVCEKPEYACMRDRERLCRERLGWTAFTVLPPWEDLCASH